MRKKQIFVTEWLEFYNSWMISTTVGSSSRSKGNIIWKWGSDNASDSVSISRKTLLNALHHHADASQDTDYLGFSFSNSITSCSRSWTLSSRQHTEMYIRFSYQKSKEFKNPFRGRLFGVFPVRDSSGNSIIARGVLHWGFCLGNFT